MFLFLVASLPLLFCCVLLLPWNARQVPRTLTLVSTFLKGVLLFFPGYLALLIVRRIFGFSWDGFLLFLSLFQQDHFFPLLAAIGGFLLIQKALAIPATDEAIFLTVFACMSGFLSMLNIADWLRTWGNWDGYSLFILPGLRAAAALAVALAAQRYYRWEGRDGVLFCGADRGVRPGACRGQLPVFGEPSGMVGCPLRAGRPCCGGGSGDAVPARAQGLKRSAPAPAPWRPRRGRRSPGLPCSYFR